MAVVVRDGGRPPDRRWQLFNNFYQVIKRREANRDLPDKRLAKLLREDDQLLKTDHNRLGFVLHSRAETSKGAHTSLDRNEFRNLVANAVSLMVEDDIAGTVDTLMQATTNRLVLVSTPDAGERLRFDIIPLQEFFAAEFLYEGVDADELRTRLELLAADSHWREVMHFLLSALVENNRQTELDVAVQILEKLDYTETQARGRILSKRLARGSLLTSRLLQEGVLEQDKRVRERFRKCLDPLAGLATSGALSALCNLAHPNSLAWFRGFLFEQLKDANRTENIGAAFLLMNLIVDGDERVKYIRECLLNTSQDYTIALLKEIKKEQSNKVIDIPNWLRDICLELLLREKWSCLKGSDIRHVKTLIGAAKERLSVAVRCGLDPAHVGLLAALFPAESGSESETSSCDYGVFRCEYFSHDWSTRSFDFGTILKKELPKEAESAPGFLQLVYRILNFARTKRHSDFVAILEIIGENIELLSGVPRHIRAYLPIDDANFLAPQLQKLKAMSAEEFSLFTKGVKFEAIVPRLMKTASFSGDCTKEKWLRCVTERPNLALSIWSDDIWQLTVMDRPKVLLKPSTIT